MSRLIDAAFTRARVTIAALLMILIAGAAAYMEIPKESNPDVRIPIIYVLMRHDGISPEDAERLLLRPMEQQLRTIEGIKEMRSTGYLGGAFVILEFDAGFNAKKALDDVRAKVDLAKPELPSDTKEPEIHEVNFSLFPVLVVTLSGTVPERTLLRLARDLKDDVKNVPGVLDVVIAGNRDERVEVVIEPLLVESYGLNAADVIRRVTANNQLIAAGALDTGRGRFEVKVPGLIESVEDLLNLPIKVTRDAVVKVRDIATVRRTYKDAETYARLGGRQAVALEVSKRTGENIIDTVERVRALVEAERAHWPAGVEVTYTQDASNHIRTMLGDLENNLTTAVLLVLIIVVATLGLRATALVGIAVPGSFLAGILLLSVMGLTVNVVVLFGLIFAAGNVVDGAIVVSEYADRKIAEGMARRDAYALAAKRMAWPIIASTATQLAAFAPLLFWPGVVGQFMKFLPITQFVTLLAALAMALIFIPVLGAFMGGKTAQEPSETRPAVDSGAFTRLYLRLLGRAVDHPLKTLALATALLVGVQWTYANHGQGVQFFPDIEPERAVIHVHARGNLSIGEQDALVREVEGRILDISELASVYARTGKGQKVQQIAEDVVGVIQIEFVDWQRRRPAREILAEIERRTRDLAGIQVEAQKEKAGPPVGKPIQVQISARETELIVPAAQRLARKFAETPGLTGVEDNRALPGIEWELRVDRAEAAKYGADVAQIGNSIKLITNGMKVTDYRPSDGDDEVDIVIRYPQDWRNLDQLDQIRVQTDLGLVPITPFVQRTPKPLTGTLYRVDGKRVITVQADVAPGVLADDKVREIKAWLAGETFDPRLDFRFKGEDLEQKKAQAFLSKAFMVALFLIAVILLLQFNSFYSAGLILTAVVMSTIGVFIGLIVTGQPFGIVMTGIGVVALAGTVVQNNIVLIDTFDEYVKVEATVRDAVMRTGRERLRPVLLTALNTVLGMVPLVMGINIDVIERSITVGAPSTQWWIQLSTAIVFGLSFATFLTLLVTPAALMARGNVQAWWRNRRAESVTANDSRRLRAAAD
ncbi:MAG: efflux RND transporter permease subunit [Alphaproteobacteria bacterium]|nr:efflux RND transporter permease subunit [Alphaproteobacteria bacterium]